MKKADITSLIRYEQLPTKVDIAIVGGGLTGLQLATDLYILGIEDILVLEAGAYLGDKHINLAYTPSESERLWLYPDEDKSFWRPWFSENPPHFAAWGGLRRRLGGRSLYWQGVTLRIEPWALTDPLWPKEVVSDLTSHWNGGASLYSRLESEIRQWSKTPIPIELASSQGFYELFNALGYMDAIITPSMVRHHYFKDHEIRVSAYSPLETWIAHSQNNKLPKIACGVEVLGILLTKTRATGLRVRDPIMGGIKEISANTVVLAAGTIENTRLAIQALYELRKIEEPVLSNLYDHLCQGLIVSVPINDIPPEIVRGIQSGPLFLIPGNQKNRSNMFVTFRTDRKTILILDMWVMGEHLPSINNYVRCEPSQHNWKTFINANISPMDTVVLSQQCEDLNNFFNRFCMLLGKKNVRLDFDSVVSPNRTLPNILPTASNLDYYTPVTWASPLGTVEHEGGTLAYARMLNNNNEIRDIESLYAIGPCTFPRMGAANPVLTSLALVRRFAESLHKG